VTFVAIAAAQQTATPGKHLAELREGLVKETQSLLRSDDWQQVAWGAYAAAEFRLTECIPELRLQLRVLEREHAEGRFTVLAILDALIQTDARVTWEDLQQYIAPPFLPSTLLLLGKDLRKNGWLLCRAFGRYGGGTDDAWYACGSMLASARDPEFVVELLRMPIALRLAVCDAGDGAEPLPAGDTVSCCPLTVVPRGFPAICYYEFSHGGGVGAILVANGAPPLVARRMHVEPGRTKTVSSIQDRSTVESARMEWFTTMLGPDRSAVVCKLEHRGTVDWTDAAAFVTAARSRLANVERAWQATVDACFAARLIDGEVAGRLRPAITVDISDLRSDRSQPLPPVQ